MGLFNKLLNKFKTRKSMISTHDYYVVILYYCNFIQKIRNMPYFYPPQPILGSFWGFFVANTWKPKFCKNMLNPIFSLYAPAASCKKEKLNAVICYNTWKTDLRHFLSKNFYSRYFLIKVIYMNFEPLCCSNL